MFPKAEDERLFRTTLSANMLTEEAKNYKETRDPVPFEVLESVQSVSNQALVESVLTVEVL